MIHHPIVIKYNIQIQHPRSETHCITNPAGTVLNGFKVVQQYQRFQNGCNFDNIIYEPVLVFIINRFGLVYRRLVHQPGGLAPDQLSYPPTAVFKLVAQVGSDTNKSRMPLDHIKPLYYHDCVVELKP